MPPQSRTNQSAISKWWQSLDRVTLGLYLGLLLCGILLSLAASPAAAYRSARIDDPFHYVYRHLLFVSVGLVGALIVSTFSPRNARRLGVLALLGALVLLVLLPFIGYSAKGAVRWVSFGPINVQPSEFVKPGFIVFAAWMFSVRKQHPEMPGTAILFLLYGILVFLLIRQPDFGQTFLLTMCFAAVFFYAGLSLRWMFILLGGSIVSIFAAYQLLPHVRDRLNRFLDPENSDTYQTDRALDAIANGGFFGRGPGEGHVKNQLPDAHTDYIFAVCVEEFGFLLSTALLLLLAAFVGRAFRNALKLNDYFSQLATAGLASMIAMQAMINIAVNLNLVPSKGMTLPFISYGGSSMLALSFSTGLILAFTRRRPGAYGFGAL